MIGLLILVITIPLLLGYLWLALFAVRFMKRKTSSNLIAALTVAGFVVLTFGDTAINRLYHHEILCNRDEVGGHVFQKVLISPEDWDVANNRPNLPLSMTSDKPFLGRYAEIRKYEKGGLFPFTAYERNETTVIDIATGRTLSRYVDYLPAGGTWWALPLRYIGQGSTIGWLLSRGNTVGCANLPPYGSVDVRESVFTIH